MTSPYSVANTPRLQLARRCRQICLESEQDAEAPAATEAKLASAFLELQSEFGAEALSTEAFHEIVATEYDRVASALLAVELLLPRLNIAPAARPPTNRRVEMPPVARASTPASPLGIADLIDGMLAQDEPPTRSHR